MIFDFYQKNQRGQGLLETVMALGVLMIGLFSVFSLVVGNFTSQQASLSRLQALNLAREGIEAVRNIRDSNWLAGRGTWEGIINQNQEGQNNELVFDFESGAKQLSAVDNFSETPVYFKNGLYLQGAGANDGTSTAFFRLINITPLLCQDEIGQAQCADLELPLASVVGIEVKSQVGWSVSGRQDSVILTEKFYDWR